MMQLNICFDQARLVDQQLVLTWSHGLRSCIQLKTYARLQRRSWRAGLPPLPLKYSQSVLHQWSHLLHIWLRRDDCVWHQAHSNWSAAADLSMPSKNPRGKKHQESLLQNLNRETAMHVKLLIESEEELPNATILSLLKSDCSCDGLYSKACKVVY